MRNFTAVKRIIRRRRGRLGPALLGLALAVMAVVASYYIWWRDAGVTVVVPDVATHPVRGIDVSAHNGDIDFERVAAAGIEFALIKATEGHSFKDRNFTDNFTRARKAGLKVGAYHFFRFDCTGYMQALNLLHSVRGRDPDLPLVIDVEEWTNPRDHTTRDVLLRLQAMVNTLEAHGYEVMLYSNKDGFERFISERFAHYPLWICSMTGSPDASRLRIWQYTHTGHVDGVTGHVDINTFNGSRDQWTRWLADPSR